MRDGWELCSGRERRKEEKMKLDDLTIGAVRELVHLFGRGSSRTYSLVLGQAYLVQTATLYFSGRLVAVTETDIVLEDAGWVAYTGRFGAAMAGTAPFAEFEPCVDPVVVARGAVVAYHPWRHELPRKVIG